MSFYANPAVIVYAQWYCTNCGEQDIFPNHDDGDRIVTDHRCWGEKEDDDDFF